MILAPRLVQQSVMFRFARRLIRAASAPSEKEIAPPQDLAAPFGVTCWMEPEKRRVFALVKRLRGLAGCCGSLCGCDGGRAL